MNAQIGTITTFAGNNAGVIPGNGGPATSALISNPKGLALDSNGNLFIAASGNSLIRQVNIGTGIITTPAGGGTGGDGGLAAAAQLTFPCDIKADSAGNLYLSETCVVASGGGGGGTGTASTSRIRRVDAVTGIITTIAGTSSSGFAGDGGLAISALLNTPGGLALDGNGNIYVADFGNNRVRRIDAASGVITTVAGNGTAAFSGDGGPATAAGLSGPTFVAVDAIGNLYISDAANQRIRRVDGVTGNISTIAGTGATEFNGDGISATTANLNFPEGLIINSDGNLVFTDYAHGRVRMIDNAGLIWTIAGGSAAASIGDNGPASMAVLVGPISLAQMSNGDLFVSENAAGRIRRVALPSTVAATALRVSSSATTFGQGVPLTFNATITASNGLGGSATGGVAFYDGSTLLGGVPVLNGVATLITSSLALGAHNLSATYVGDANFGGSFSPGFPVTVVVLPPSIVTLTSNPNPSTIMNVTTFTATLTPNTATGTVQFRKNGSLLGSGTISAGVATYTTNFLPLGPSSITAVYSGDGNNSAGTSVVLTQNVVAFTSLALTSSQNPALPGTPVTFTVTVYPTTATGTVQFLDGTTVLGTATFAGGTATFTTSSLSQGTHSVTASYGGDASNGSSTSPPISQGIKVPAGLSTAVTPNPATVGQIATLTANVNNAATGTVQFLDGTTVLATVNVASGAASFSTTALSAGTHSIGMNYNGDSNYMSASGAVISLTVLGTSSTTFSSSANPAGVAQSITFTATEVPASSTGTVQFFDGATSLGTVALTSGTATFTTSALTLGNHALQAVYGGDATHAGSTGNLTQAVKGASGLSAGTSANPVLAGQAVTFTASVGPSVTGSITFTDGATPLAVVAIASGKAVYSSASLTPGSHSIGVSYGGDGGYLPASTLVAETVLTVSNTVLSSSVNPSLTGENVVFIAAVAPNSVTGSVRFYDGGTLVATVAIASGSATFSTASLTQGVHSITANYLGDANNGASVSGALNQTVNQAPPIAPANLASAAAGASQINLSWTASASVGVSYNVYASTSAGFSPSAANRMATGVGATAYSAIGLSASTTYYFRVTAVNGGGESAASNQASAATSGGTIGCHVVYSVTSQWSNGFNGAFSIKNTGSTTLNSWTLTWTWANSQAINQAWNANYTQSGKNVTMTNLSFNAQIAAGATRSGMGFGATFSNSNTAPTKFFVNGVQCQ